jgi:hypothetical protein
MKIKNFICGALLALSISQSAFATIIKNTILYVGDSEKITVHVILYPKMGGIVQYDVYPYRGVELQLKDYDTNDYTNFQLQSAIKDGKVAYLNYNSSTQRQFVISDSSSGMTIRADELHSFER